MRRIFLGAACLVLSAVVSAQSEKRPENPLFEYRVAETHEIKPHRRTIPVEGVEHGFNQLRLTLTVSAAGDVLTAAANGDQNLMKFWPQLEPEVRS
jgi:hypothetical protein